MQSAIQVLDSSSFHLKNAKTSFTAVYHPGIHPSIHPSVCPSVSKAVRSFVHPPTHPHRVSSTSIAKSCCTMSSHRCWLPERINEILSKLSCSNLKERRNKRKALMCNIIIMVWPLWISSWKVVKTDYYRSSLLDWSESLECITRRNEIWKFHGSFGI